MPVRRVGRQLQVCLIRRKVQRTWGIPKGMVDSGCTHEETALTESEEEAGVTGRILGPPIGSYTYRKWSVDLTVAVFVLEVFEQHATWREAAFRERMWTPFAEAAALLAHHPVAPLLGRAYTLVTEGPYRLA